MKKVGLITLISFIVLISILVTTQYRSIKPIFTSPEKDIIERIDESNRLGINNTDFPLEIPNNTWLRIYASGYNKPRDLLSINPKVMLVSDSDEGTVVALIDENVDGKLDEEKVLLSDLNKPHGLDVNCNNECKLFVAETDRVVEYILSLKDLRVLSSRKLVDLPSEGRHWSRSLLYMPDEEKLLISVGSSCDVCNESDWRRAGVLVFDMKTHETKLFAEGLRNAVFLSNNPNDNSVWVTEMGRDRLGDNLPPEEINILYEGGHYGWPYCFGNQVRDVKFNKTLVEKDYCSSTIMPHATFQAHSAPLGLTFIPDSWPEEYAGDLLVSYHGSWNRSVPTGYSIARFDLSTDGIVVSEYDFISGWLTEDDTSLGRPVDVEFDDNGNLYISDDKAGVIYRLEFLN